MVGVLKTFDIPSELYADDVKNIAGLCIGKFGLREWKAAVLTNEIHGHLGIYSTVGAKMGLRARELFEEAGCKGEISAVSFAGLQPPVSCLNDGLQVGSGASLGHGLISVSDEPEKRVEARFSCEGKSLTLSLKPEYSAIIRADIKEGVERYGHSPAYWQYIRNLALRYWSTWARWEIFDCR